MILKDKKFLFTGILTDKSIAYASAKIAIESAGGTATLLSWNNYERFN